MYKTSVYLDDEDKERLRRLQRRTGKSQAELIRDGIRQLDGDALEFELPRSIGAASWPVRSRKERRWDADELAAARGLEPR